MCYRIKNSGDRLWVGGGSYTARKVALDLAIGFGGVVVQQGVNCSVKVAYFICNKACSQLGVKCCQWGTGVHMVSSLAYIREVTIEC